VEKTSNYTTSLGIFIVMTVVTLGSWLVSMQISEANMVQWSDLSGRFLAAWLTTGVTFTAATLLLNQAYRESELSIVGPITNFSPLFTLLVAPILLQEFPTWLNLVGIALILLGSYLLKIDKQTRSPWEPLKALVNDRGARLTVLVAFIWGLETALSKVGALETNPYFWTFSNKVLTLLLLIPIALWKDPQGIKQLPKQAWVFVAMGSVIAMAMILQSVAVVHMNSAVAGALLRLSTLFNIVFGFIFFGERKILNRLFAAAVMVAGVVLVVSG
jgi:drug/metabolite transporter (DMT)-like permease